MRPSVHQFRLFGPTNGLSLDEDHQTLIKLKGKRLKSYAERFVPPLNLAKQELKNVTGNVRKFLANDFHMKAGMKCLIEDFYRSIALGMPLPISYREILLVSRMMDSIFEQLNGKKTEAINGGRLGNASSELFVHKRGN
jgi:hypothetical protein